MHVQNLITGSIEIAHIEQIYRLLDLLSSRMTDLQLHFYVNLVSLPPKKTLHIETFKEWKTTICAMQLLNKDIM